MNSKKRNKNPILKLQLNCLNCNNEFIIEVIESYFERGRYQKCCCKKCSHEYINKITDHTLTKIIKCKNCNKEIVIRKNSSNHISCDECKKEERKKRYKIFKNNTWVCSKCGGEKCKKPEICKKMLKNNVFEKYLGFDSTKKGTEYFYKEFDRIVEQLKKDYFDNELSLPEIGKKYKISYQSIQTVFTNLGIKIRTNQDGLNLALKNGKVNFDKSCSNKYKQGYHTTWDNRQVHYRSSYEKDYYEKLDEQKIFYEVEKLRLIYFDTQKNKRRIAIPDVFIPNENLITEIKSTWTHDEQNWKDRLKSYKKLKYKVKLVIGDDRKNMKEINYY